MTRAAAAWFRFSRAEMSGLRTPDCSSLPQACGLLTLPGCAGKVRGACATSLSRPEVAQAWPQQRCGPRCLPRRTQQPGFTRISRPVRGQVSSGAGTNAARASVHAKGCLGAPGPRRSPPSLREIRLEAPCSGRCDVGLEADDGRTSGARCALLAPRLSWHPLTGGLTGTASQAVSAWMVLLEMVPPGWSGRESWGSGWWRAAVSSAMSHLPNVTLTSGRKRVKGNTRNNLLRKNLNGCFWL